MSKQSKHTSSLKKPVSDTSFWIARLLLVGAISLSVYLAWTALSGGAVAGCGPNEACSEVLGSRWAYWFGVPVSLLGLPVYIALLTASFSLDPRVVPVFRQRAWLTILAGLILTIGGAVWFTGLQLTVLKAFCPYCLTTHVCAALGAWIIWSGRPDKKTSPNQKPTAQGSVPSTQRRTVVMYSCLALAALAGGQILAPQKTNVVTTLPSAPAVTSTNITPVMTQAVTTAANTLTSTPSAARLSQPPATISDRSLALHNGRFALELQRVPLHGSIHAPHVMVSLFDYTCHHCRDMHKLLKEVSQTFSNELVIVSLPMPLSADCNRLLRATAEAHANACYYARLGLAVYLAAPQKFAQFDDWLFQTDKPPATMQAKQFAEELVGKDALTLALMNPQVENLLQQSINLYEANYQQTRNGKMPQLILGPRISAGTIARVEDLYQLLDDSFGLKRK